MASDNQAFILTPKDPVGRLVGGSVGRGNDKDAAGHPYIIKTGPKAGQPTVKYYVGIAIPKIPGHTHWSQTEWGAAIWRVGHTAFPGIAQNPSFAWKVEDGDSVIPNTNGKRPADRPGYKGCWVLHCGTSLPIKACNADGSAAIDPAQIKCGYYVQVAIMCQGNGSPQKPGVYLNPQAVALAGVGEEIAQGMNTASVGFGGAALPAGATLPPNLLTPAAPPVPGVAPAAPALPPTYAPPVPAAQTPPVPGVAPNAAILAVPPVPPMPAAPAGPAPTAKAAGATLDQMLAWPGWNLETLKSQGYVV